MCLEFLKPRLVETSPQPLEICIFVGLVEAYWPFSGIKTPLLKPAAVSDFAGGDQIASPKDFYDIPRVSPTDAFETRA